jgi:hypothetical protein
MIKTIRHSKAGTSGKTLLLVSSILASGFLSLQSCSKKAEAPAITSLEAYQDKSLGFGIKAPKNWKASTKPGELATYYSSEQVAQRFVDYKDAEVAGAQVAILANKLTGPTSLDSMLNLGKIFAEESAYKPIEDVTIAGVKGRKLSYDTATANSKAKPTPLPKTPPPSRSSNLKPSATPSMRSNRSSTKCSPRRSSLSSSLW